MCRKPKLCRLVLIRRNTVGAILRKIPNLPPFLWIYPSALIDGNHLPVLTTETVIGKKVRRVCENHIKTAVWMFFQYLPHDVKGIFVVEDKVV